MSSQGVKCHNSSTSDGVDFGFLSFSLGPQLNSLTQFTDVSAGDWWF